MKRLIFAAFPLLVLFLAFRPVQSHTVTGTVKDETGNPLFGVSVVEKGTKNGSVVDTNGRYTITISKNNGILQFTGVGLRSKEIRVQGRSKIDVVLNREVMQVSEVVVTAFGTHRQAKSLGYATTMPGAYDYPAPRYYPGEEGRDREGYDPISENKFLKVSDNPLSTFSIDVDAASYSNVRRILNQGQLPPAGALRIEEMINYFKYDYPQPKGEHPFSINTEIADAPWNKEHKLVLIGLQGKKIPVDNLPPSNLVFLIDVSGSMMAANKLPLVQQSMKMLVDQLREQDMVSIVVYAGAAGLVLPPTSGYEKQTIKDPIDQLSAGGSTAGGAGIKLAYKTARENFLKEGNNRVILCTDGDFNVGESSDDAMVRLIEKERNSGVFLTVLGYGMGNYQDAKMQKLADKGNGNQAYIDGLSEVKKVLVNEFGGTLFTIAKDVKLQVEFNPAKVKGYRLIGYENRMLAKEDFNDDKKDAGELGSAHTVTALYEIIPVGVNSEFLKNVDSLKYRSTVQPLSASSHNGEMLTVKFRYKAPGGDQSKLIEHPVQDRSISLASASENFRFAASVAEFGMLLRSSEFKSSASYENVISLARGAKKNDPEGYRDEFLKLVKKAQNLAATTASVDSKE